MSSAKENEDESAEPVPTRPVEKDSDTGEQGIPVQQLDLAAPDPMEEDKPLPPQNRIPSFQTREAPLVELKFKPPLVQNETPSSKTVETLNDVSHEDQPGPPPHEIHSSQPVAPLNDAAHGDNSVPATSEAPSSQTLAPSDDAIHEDNLVPEQDMVTSSQAEVPFNDNSKDEISSSQAEASSHGDGHAEVQSAQQPPHQDSALSASLDVGKNLLKPEAEAEADANAKPEGNEILLCKTETCVVDGTAISTTRHESVQLTLDAKAEPSQRPETESGHDIVTGPKQQSEPATPLPPASNIKSENESGKELNNGKKQIDVLTPQNNGNSSSKRSFLLEDSQDGSESGTEEEQLAFMKELHNFFRERSMEFKPPKFYGEGLNCLKLWRSVMRLGGYDKVTTFKLWRQVGESFKPPKTCTTVSWTFRGFYEKRSLAAGFPCKLRLQALLDYERYKTGSGELNTPVASNSEPMTVDNQASYQASGSGRARRDAAARAMQGWHSERLLDNGEVSYPIIKDKNSISSQKREKQLKNLGLLKRKKPTYDEDTVKAARSKPAGPQVDVEVVDIGPPADWVKINVQRTKDSYEVYALVPGLLREEVRVQSDPAGRLVISGEPEHPENPWGVTAFKKVVSLPSRIDPHQTSAVVTLHGQLLVRVPFERSG
ncbi:AT-rich interactive domain-containing protein 3 [Turnera subulata]|uniref:AT-rich interactive domain-containing protein 3 n=1 Tax=Turnera subulata TaxID=218843 RepID=A0A9Q0FFU9_9ROSI|nr:AT-rich interactive domain-containing protein 3 [Turnera subulata]